MRLITSPLICLTVLLVLSAEYAATASAKKPSRPRSTTGSSSSSSRRRPPPEGQANGSRPSVSQRRKPVVDDEEDEIDDFAEPAFDSMLPSTTDEEELEEEEAFDEEEEEEEYVPRPKSRKASSSDAAAAVRRPPPANRPPGQSDPRSRRPPPQSGRRPPPRFEDDEEEFRDKPRPRPSSGGGPKPKGPVPRGAAGRAGPRPTGPAGRRPGASVVPYTRHQQQPSVFARSLDVIRSSMPDPNTIREVASNSINAVKATTTSLSANMYREIKGLTSSELEQVLLKSTRPDDTAVKGKHVERLVGVTYQISSRYDIYDAVLRKLWAKMAEKDWRTKIKALYILHRFSADGAPEHAAALKARLRELRRTRDPKRKDKYFNSKQLLAGEATPDTVLFRAFMSRYAHYVILRAQCFGGVFDEISAEPKADKKKPPKPITSTALRAEHLEAAAMLLKAGLACQLKDGEECENTAIAAERVASDMIGLTAAVAIALNRVLKDEDLKGGDPVLIKKWCELYKKQLLPQTKGMVKKMSSKLDAYGLFLPSRMGTSVSPELLERGLNLEEEDAPAAEEGEAGEAEILEKEEPKESTKAEQAEEDDEEDEEETDEPEVSSPEPKTSKKEPEAAKKVAAAATEEEGVLEDEYEYDEEEYYDDEEE